jgi:hypothetical protein
MVTRRECQRFGGAEVGLEVRFVSVNEDFERVYSDADSSTLVGLEPLLRERMERVKERMKGMDLTSQGLASQSAGLAETRAETLMALARRQDVTEEQATEFRELLDQLVATDAELSSNMAKSNEEAYSALFAYLVELEKRRRAICAVLRDRNLLPDPPY